MSVLIDFNTLPTNVHLYSAGFKQCRLKYLYWQIWRCTYNGVEIHCTLCRRQSFRFYITAHVATACINLVYVNSLVCHYFCHQNWKNIFNIVTLLCYNVTCLLVNMAAVTMIQSASSFKYSFSLLENHLSFTTNSVMFLKQTIFGFPETSVNVTSSQ